MADWRMLSILLSASERARPVVGETDFRRAVDRKARFPPGTGKTGLKGQATHDRRLTPREASSRRCWRPKSTYALAQPRDAGDRALAARGVSRRPEPLTQFRR